MKINPLLTGFCKTSIILLVIIPLLSTTPIFAQDALLTKNETVSYLAKKYKEMEGATASGTYSLNVYKNFSLKYEDNCIILSHSVFEEATGKWKWDQLYKFNPLYIKNITFYTLNEMQALDVNVSLSGVDKHKNSNGEFTKTTTGISFIFLGTRDDRSNGNKIKKALLHLQALLKAEDDPFGD